MLATRLKYPGQSCVYIPISINSIIIARYIVNKRTIVK